MITFIIPTRNNLPYLKLAYGSIRSFYPGEEIIILDDNSTDGTKDWISSVSDSNTLYYHNDGRQVGHTVLYDIGVAMADNEIFTIFHADMVCGPNYVENLLKHLKPKGVVAATRIEPPLHPPGKEKIVLDFGTYDHDFRRSDFVSKCRLLQQELTNKDVTTKGIFAPWAMYKQDFINIGGHDKFFCPFPYEDSDIFQRFILNNYDVKQSRDAFVYHFTCRGHRWTEQIQKDDLFYKLCCAKNSMHFIRKWGHWIENDENCYPIIHKKYDIGVFISGKCPNGVLQHIEPWFRTIYADSNDRQKYIDAVQPGTPFRMNGRVKPYFKPMHEYDSHDIDIYIDGGKLVGDNIRTLALLPKMIEDSGEVGDMEYGDFRLLINRLNDYAPELVTNVSTYYTNQLIEPSLSDLYCTDELFRVFEQVKKHS